MTRPERTAAHPLEEPEEPVTGSARESDESGEEALPSFSEQLAEQLGGWRGLIESSIPVTVFVIVNVVTSLRPAIIVSVASGLLIAVYRLSRRQSVRHAVNGLFGIFIGAAIAWRSGEARDFYLPGIIISALYALAMVWSRAIRLKSRNTRSPRSSFHQAVVTSGDRRSTSRANASAQRRTSGNVQLGSIRQATWMPRLPDVFGQPV